MVCEGNRAADAPACSKKGTAVKKINVSSEVLLRYECSQRDGHGDEENGEGGLDEQADGRERVYGGATMAANMCPSVDPALRLREPRRAVGRLRSGMAPGRAVRAGGARRLRASARPVGKRSGVWWRSSVP